MDEDTKDMTAAEQEKRYYELLDMMAPEARAAMIEITEFMAYELPKDVSVTQAQIEAWVSDVLERNRKAKIPNDATVIPFARNNRAE